MELILMAERQILRAFCEGDLIALNVGAQPLLCAAAVCLHLSQFLFRSEKLIDSCQFSELSPHLNTLLVVGKEIKLEIESFGQTIHQPSLSHM
jgi:hypothetical protein